MIASAWNKLLRLRVIPSISCGKIFRVFIICTALSAPFNQAAAVTLTWGAGGVGGTGTWNTSNLNWWTSTANVAWPTTGTDNDAIFAGAAGGNLGVGSAVSVNDMMFNTTGYNLSGSAITLNGTTPRITTAANVSTSIGNPIAGSAGLYKAGAGTLTLSSSTSSWTGGTFIEAGRIALGIADNRLPTSTIVTLGSAGSSGTLQLGSSTFAKNQTLGGLLATGLGGNVVGSNNGTTANLTLNIASGTINTFGGNGVIGGSSVAENNIALIKTGTGTLELTRANTYTAGTTVSTGTLLANNSSGSSTGTGAVAVAAGATLGGSGSIAGATTVSGILAPGNSIGTLTVANDVIWNGSSLLGGGATTNWKFELGAANTADLLRITGAASEFTKGSGSVFCFDFLGSTQTGTFTLVDWDSIASVGGGVAGTSFAATDFTYTNLGSSNTGSFQFNGSQLEFQAVPEPSTTALSLLSAVLFGTHLAIRRRRRV
ncbi:MAG: autotransporter-associated beta strand repeat-containing protein [Candidatus Pacebacteria bacterium]|nr:autotransporter-associated beta strand repeat-containing protein [Candidatus Paceibacterota bacterium]